MSIDVVIVPGPAFLASALINGDLSGLEDGQGDPEQAKRDLATLDAFLAYCAPGAVVSIASDESGETMEPYFGRFDFPEGTLGCDLVDYVVHYREGDQ